MQKYYKLSMNVLGNEKNIITKACWEISRIIFIYVL